MKSQFLGLALFLAAAVSVSAETLSLSGSDAPSYAVVSGDQGAVTLWQGDAMVRTWSFPGPFAVAAVLAGPTDRLEWEGAAGTLVASADEARLKLDALGAPRLLWVGSDGAVQILKAPEEEKEAGYDAATAATEE